MRYGAFKDFLATRLGYDIEFYPGPDLPADTANRFVVLTRTGGPGLTTEDLIDTSGWQVRVAGPQGDHDGAEAVAFDLDAVILRHGHSQRMTDGTWLVDMYRSGSPPTELLIDDAERTHFVCGYLCTVQSALA